MGSDGDYIVSYLIAEIPDPDDSRYFGTQGNVQNSIFSGSEGLLHQISHMLSGVVTAELLYVFTPECQSHDRQSRLRIYLRLWAKDPETAQKTAVLIERGELSRFYHFERVTHPLNLPRSLIAACDILRHQEFVKPLFGCGQNKNVPGEYLSIRPFIPNDKHDFLTEDRVLDGVREPVAISIRIQPADTSLERRGMTALMERLHLVNHPKDWRHDDFDDLGISGNGTDSLLGRHREFDTLNRRDPLAEEIRRSLRDIHEPLYQKPHLLFSIRVMAQTCETAQLMAAVFAGSAFKEGDYQLIISRKGESLFDGTMQEFNMGIRPFETYRYIWSKKESQDHENLRRLVQLTPVAEFLGAFRLPVASVVSPLCIRRNTDSPYETGGDVLRLGFDEQGVQGNLHPKPVGIPLSLLTKHISVFGLSGAGKTTHNFELLFQLHEKNIPFIVIETAKTEYRVIKKHKNHNDERYRGLARDLQVYTAAVEECSPLRFNSLEVLQGIKADVHVDNLIECLDAVVAMPPYVRSILREALLDLYYAHPNEPPTMADLYTTAMTVLSRKGYCGEVYSNIQGVLDTRVGDLTRGIVGRLFDSPYSFPSIPNLMNGYTVLELDVLTKDFKCAVTLWFLTAIREYLRTLPPAKGLRFVILIEECHNVFGRGGKAHPSEEAADPAAYVAAFISRMLAELRALGVGVILSEQFPSQIDPMAMKCTSTKLAFQQVHGEDRADLATSMLLTDSEAEDLARLKPGEAFLFCQGYFRPLRIKTTNLHEELDLTQFPTKVQLREIVRDEPWYDDAHRARARAELGRFQAEMNKLSDRKIQIVQQMQGLQRHYATAVERARSTTDRKRLIVIRNEARKLRRSLFSAREAFRRGPYRLYGPALGLDDLNDRGLQAWAQSLAQRLEDRVEQGISGVLERMDRFIEQCTDSIVKGANHGTHE